MTNLIQSKMKLNSNLTERAHVIFIAGLMRSGSTLIDLLLGAHPDFVGLGELHQFLEHSQEYIERKADIQCSCGNTLEMCEFWSKMIDTVIENPAQDTLERYSQMMNIFCNVFGSQRVLVDSSKSIQSLAVWQNMPNVDVRVLYVVRDVRAWTILHIDSYRRSKEYYLTDLVKKMGWKAWKGFLRRSTMALFLKWYLDNRTLSRYLSKEGIVSMQIGYEELSLYPESMLKLICEFLGVQFTESMLLPKESHSHVGVGNRMRFQEGKLARIYYDNRWFYRNEWQFQALLLPFVMRYNSEQVYRNLRSHLWVD